MLFNFLADFSLILYIKNIKLIVQADIINPGKELSGPFLFIKFIVAPPIAHTPNKNKHTPIILVVILSFFIFSSLCTSKTETLFYLFS